MRNLTVRNIPDGIMRKIKTLSVIERRSLNCEMLLLIEKGLSREMSARERSPLNMETQVRLWEELGGAWKDARSTKKIISDIYESRTSGRDVSL